jgi:hypothetical protein
MVWIWAPDMQPQTLYIGATGWLLIVLMTGFVMSKIQIRGGRDLLVNRKGKYSEKRVLDHVYSHRILYIGK